MKENRLLTERETAQLLGLSIATLRNHRFQKKGLPYIKFGRCVRYRLSDIEKFVNQHLVVPENDRGRL